jgi:putative transposon-encoded protein
MSRLKVELRREHLHLHDEVDGFFEKMVTKFGNSAKIDCPKEFIGRKVYVIVCKKEEKE